MFSCADHPFVHPLWTNLFFKYFTQFLIGCLLLSSKVSLCIPEHMYICTSPTPVYIYLQIFSLVMYVAFSFSWWCPRIHNFDEVQFIYFIFVAWVYGVLSKKSLPNPKSGRFTSVFFYKFLVLAFILSFLFQFVVRKDLILFFCK